MKYGRRTTSVARQQAAKELADKDESDFTDWLPLLGTAAGGALAIPTGGLSLAAIPAIAQGAALGGSIGSSIDALADGDVARMGQGAMGLADLATDKKSAEIIRKILGGPKVTTGVGVLGDSLYNRRSEDAKGIGWDLL